MHIKSSFILANKRGKTATLHAMKLYGTSGCTAPLILKVISQLHGPLALRAGKQLPVPTDYEVGWTPQPVWKF